MSRRRVILISFFVIVSSILVVVVLFSKGLISKNNMIYVHKVLGVESAGPQTRLLYPSAGCGDYLGLRVPGDNEEHLVIVSARNWSVVNYLPFPFSSRKMGAFRSIDICNGTAYVLTMLPGKVLQIVSRTNVTRVINNVTTVISLVRYIGSFTSLIYRVDRHGLRLLVNTSLFAPSMVLEKNYIVLVGVNGSRFYYDPGGKHWWHPVIELRSHNGRLLARRVLGWNISDNELGGVLVDTRVIDLGHGLFLAVFGSRPNTINLSDIPRKLLLGLFRIEGYQIEPIRLFVFPKPGIYNILHAALYHGRLYVLYQAPGKWPSFYPEVYVYDARSGRLILVARSSSSGVRSGCFVVYKNRVYVVVFVPLLASSGFLPKSAALVVLYSISSRGLSVVAKYPVRIHGYVDWDFTEYNHQLRDLDNDGAVDIVNKAFSVSFFGGSGANKVYLIDFELKR